MRAQKLATYWPQLLLGLLVLVIAVINYSPDTWLSGWDNLHPEFNFSLNIKRSLSAVWQEYQGVGLLGGMGHASDLPRQLFLWLASVFIPTSLLRYFYTYLCLFLGPLGLYCLAKNLLTKEKLFALLAALFYLLNLATVQNFYFPFAPFITHFAFLPWLLLFFFQYLTTGQRKTLFRFFLFSLFGLPQAYVPTLFIVYGLSLSCLGLFYLFKNRNNLLSTTRRLIILLIIILATNAFWLFPQIYFTFKNSAVVAQAKMNQMVTQENFLKSQKYGDLGNVALLKNFWFENTDLNPSGRSEAVMLQWQNHVDQPLVRVLGYGLFCLVIFGFLSTLFKKDYLLLSLGVLFLVSFTMIASRTPPFSLIVSFLREHLPFFSQIFRFPFTKFATLLSFSFAVFFCLGIKNLVDAIPQLTSVKLTLFSTFFLLLIVFTLPVFQGHLFYARLKLRIPEEYFDLFSWFQKQDPNYRIANFPQFQFWGWSWYRFGYTGSGFLWYGLPQPILDRAFDTWSDKNEGYFWEISHAIYSKNLSLLENLVEKYQIKYLLLDKNILAPGNQKVLNLANLERMFNKSEKISLVQEFGQLKVYENKLDSKFKDFVSLLPLPPSISPPYKWTNLDTAFTDTGHYFTPLPGSRLSATNLYYPFRSLFTQNGAPENLEIQSKPEISFSTTLPPLGKGLLELPNLAHQETIIPVRLEIDRQAKKLRLHPLLPRIELGQETIKLDPQPIEVPFPPNLDPNNSLITLNQEKVAETGFMFTDRPNEIHFFLKTPRLTLNLGPESFNDQAIRYAPYQENEKFSLEKTDKKIILKAKRAAPGVSLKSFPEAFSPGDLVRISLRYQSRQDEQPVYCLYSEERRNCLNEKSKKDFGFSTDWQLLDDYTVAIFSPQDNLNLQLLLDAYDQETLKTISYQDVQIEVYPFVNLEKVFLNLQEFSYPAQEVDLSQPTEFKVSFPSFEASFNPPEVISNHQFRFQPKSCSPSGSPNFGKETQTNQNKETIITYQAVDGDSCEQFVYPSLPHDWAYLLSFETKNISGSPFKIYTTNHQNQRGDIITFLEKTDDWQTQNLILPPREPSGQGYSLIVENVSFGHLETKNQLSEVKIQPCPFWWLKSIKLETGNTLAPKNPNLPQVKKKAFFWYQVTVPSINQESLLVLSQAFDSGWVAFQGQKKLTPALVNNWENGWIIKKEGKINIFYWPQILEFVGLAALITLLIYFANQRLASVQPRRFQPTKRSFLPYKT